MQPAINSYAILLVRSTSHAIKAEKQLMQHHIECKLIPVPREISSDCGVCLRVATDMGMEACKLLVDIQIELAGFYPDFVAS